MRAYILGPMTGLPDFNRPAFRTAAAELRLQGYEVTSPDELDERDPVSSAEPQWADYMRRDLPWLSAAHIGFALPGWRNSKGASLEACVLNSLGCPVCEFTDGSCTVSRVLRADSLPTVVHN